MKPFATLFLSLFLVVTGFSSCEDDAAFPRTGENGRPSMIQEDDYVRYFSYAGNKITKIQTNSTFVSEYEYTNNVLSSIYTYPIDERIADGNGKTTFKREGNKIIIESWGEPSFDIYMSEIELDENDVPVKITDSGTFGHTDNGIQKVRDGLNYTTFSFDPQTRNMLKKETFQIKTSEKLSTVTYEYADTPGILSKIDLPLWFFAYRNYLNSVAMSSYQVLFHNYSGNLVKAVIDNMAESYQATAEYTYEYNEAGFPVKLNNLYFNGESVLTIRY